MADDDQHNTGPDDPWADLEASLGGAGADAGDVPADDMFDIEIDAIDTGVPQSSAGAADATMLGDPLAGAAPAASSDDWGDAAAAEDVRPLSVFPAHDEPAADAAGVTDPTAFDAVEVEADAAADAAIAAFLDGPGSGGTGIDAGARDAGEPAAHAVRGSGFDAAAVPTIPLPQSPDAAAADADFEAGFGDATDFGDGPDFAHADGSGAASEATNGAAATGGFGVIGFDADEDAVEDAVEDAFEAADAEAADMSESAATAATGAAADADFDFGMAGAAVAAAGAAAMGGGQAGADVLARGVGGQVVRGSNKPRKRKKSGVVGQLIGVVGGGLLAVPIVGGILLGRMWLGGPDTVGIAKFAPDVLLPERLRRGDGGSLIDTIEGIAGSSAAPDAGGGQSGGGLDSLPVVDVPATPSLDDSSGASGTGEQSPGSQAPEPGDAPVVAAVPGVEPAPTDLASSMPRDVAAPAAGITDPLTPDPLTPDPLPVLDGAPASSASEPAPGDGAPAPAPTVDPDAGPTVSIAPPTLASGLPADEPGVPSADPSAPAEPMPAEPKIPADHAITADNPPAAAAEIPDAVGARVAPEPALDLSGLDAAVAQASDAIEAVAALPGDAQPDAPARLRLLVDWYKSLAAVAEQAAALEGTAVESGIPWSGPPESLARLHGDLAAHAPLAEDLNRLARDWLRFGNRGTEGVVLPATFAAARRVGPYWVATVTVPQPDAGPVEVSVITRQEPGVQPGDRAIVTGLLFRDGIVWATDVRQAPAGF